MDMRECLDPPRAMSSASWGEEDTVNDLMGAPRNSLMEYVMYTSASVYVVWRKKNPEKCCSNALLENLAVSSRYQKVYGMILIARKL